MTTKCVLWILLAGASLSVGAKNAKVVTTDGVVSEVTWDSPVAHP